MCAMCARRVYTPEELTKASRLLLEMRDRCIETYGAYQGKAKAEALDIALEAIDIMPDWVLGKAKANLDNVMENISKRYVAELQVYPTNDGRMKYELYVKLPEE